MKRSLSALAALTLVALSACQDTNRPTTDLPSFDVTATAPDRFIVVFGDQVSDVPGLAHRLAQAEGGTVGFTYQHALKGFAFEGSARAAEALRHNPNVAYVEADQPVYAIGTQTNPPSWGLDRVDQRDLPLDDSYSYANDGSGVTVYIIDTGIRTSHNDFGGRASVGFDAVGDGQNGQDCHGHGTHVAGTAGGTSYGIAKNVSLVAVRVLNCSGSGTISGVIAGVDWVTANHAASAAANMSLGGGFSSALNTAVSNSIASGVTYAVAAGNGNFAGIPQDACSTSPASTPDALTIGATNSSDHEASFSNYGTCVDLLAPGVSITSDWDTGDNATNTISGTSMATPHVAGTAALYLSANPGATAAQVAAAIVGNATPDHIALNRASQKNHTPNLLLYSGFLGAPPPPPPPPPGGFTLTATGYKVRGIQMADLSWSGTTAASIDVYRDNTVIGTVSNNGAYTDNIGNRGGGSYVYQVCEAGTTTCSNTATVTF